MARRTEFKVPREVRVLGKRFRVVVDKSMGDSEVGDSCCTTYRIRLNPKYAEQYESTLLHEIIHCALGVSGVSQRLTEKLEESIVVCLENALSEMVSLQ